MVFSYYSVENEIKKIAGSVLLN